MAPLATEGGGAVAMATIISSCMPDAASAGLQGESYIKKGSALLFWIRDVFFPQRQKVLGSKHISNRDFWHQFEKGERYYNVSFTGSGVGRLPLTTTDMWRHGCCVPRHASSSRAGENKSPVPARSSATSKGSACTHARTHHDWQYVCSVSPPPPAVVCDCCMCVCVCVCVCICARSQKGVPARPPKRRRCRVPGVPPAYQPYIQCG